MDENKVEEFEKFTEDTKLELIHMEEEVEDEKVKKIINSLRSELENWFSQILNFINEHKDSEKTAEIIDNVKKETEILVNKVKQKANDMKEDEKIKDFVNSAREVMQEFYNKLRENETYQKVKYNIVSTLDNICNDENVKQGVKKVKTSTLKFAKKALSKIEDALQDEDEIIIHTIKKEEDEEK